MTMDAIPFFVRVALVLALGVVAAGIRVLFVQRTGQGKSASAATYHTIISASAAYGAILYVDSNVLVVPLLLGCWVGTYFTVRHAKRAA